MIGKSGIAMTKLNLSGIVLIDGIQYNALGRNFHIPVGARIKVIGEDMGNLLVLLAEDQSTEQGILYPPYHVNIYLTQIILK